MTTTIRPALTPAQWKEHRAGAVFVHVVDDETHVVVADPDNQLVSVSGPSEVFALMALANDALPDDDPRKLTRADVALLNALLVKIDAREPSGMLAIAEALRDKVAALLPPR